MIEISTSKLLNIANIACDIGQRADALADDVMRLLQPMPDWRFPVNEPAGWYAYTLHDETGRRNNGYRHTGIDINLDKKPFGDVDRGQPIYSVCAGLIYAVHYSRSYLGGVVIQATHDGKPLYIRYWHLADNDTFRGLVRWRAVRAGQLLGHIGNYKLGDTGDHLHFDMRTEPFYAHWWFTRHPGDWIDPVPVLEAHLDPALVREMLRKEAR